MPNCRFCGRDHHKAAQQARKWAKVAIVMGWLCIAYGLLTFVLVLWVMSPDWYGGHAWMLGAAALATAGAAFGVAWMTDHTLDQEGYDA